MLLNKASTFLVFILVVVPSNSSFSSPTTQAKKLKIEVFGNSQKSECQILNKGPSLSSRKGPWPTSVTSLVSTFIETMKEGSANDINKLFHAKIKLKKDFGEKIYYSLKRKYQTPWDITVNRLWALNNPSEFKEPITCITDQVILTPHFGYSFQYGVWLQIMSKTELGRIYLTIVPSQKKWVFAAIHLQQWTFMGKDAEYWTEKGLQQAAQQKVKAHISLDIAQKMLFGGSLIEFPFKNKLINHQDSVFSKDEWLASAKKISAPEDLVYIGTLLAPEGPGIVARMRTLKEISMQTAQTKCKILGRKFFKKDWIGHKSGGLRCDFVYPREPITKRGILGSQYFTIPELLKK